MDTSGPWGAYLVGARPDRTRPAKGYWVPAKSPGSGLVSITYRDGHSCRIRNPRALGGAKPCPRVGYVPTKTPAPTPAQLATPIKARFAAKPEWPRIGRSKPVGPKQWRLTVSFTPRVPAGPRSFYFVLQRIRGSGICGGGSLSPIGRNVRAGQRVTQTLYVPARCRGRVTVEVRYQPPSDSARPTPFTPENPFRAPLVGRYTARIPPL